LVSLVSLILLHIAGKLFIVDQIMLLINFPQLRVKESCDLPV
jgi:hypothetical protein